MFQGRLAENLCSSAVIEEPEDCNDKETDDTACESFEQQIEVNVDSVELSVWPTVHVARV